MDKPARVRFGRDELDRRSGELLKSGSGLRLQERPLRVLEARLDHAGEVVTREELRRRLWSDDTFVDFDNGVNSAINRLRTSLGDNAEKPRFIETVGRRGYRFIAGVAPPDESHLPCSSPVERSIVRAQRDATDRRRRVRLPAGIGLRSGTPGSLGPARIRPAPRGSRAAASTGFGCIRGGRRSRRAGDIG